MKELSLLGFGSVLVLTKVRFGSVRVLHKCRKLWFSSYILSFEFSSVLYEFSCLTVSNLTITQWSQIWVNITGKLIIGVVKFYNDNVVQAVTFAYLIYRRVSCSVNDSVSYADSSTAISIKYEVNVYQVKLSVSSVTTGCIWLCVSSIWSDTASFVVQQLALITSS